MRAHPWSAARPESHAGHWLSEATPRSVLRAGPHAPSRLSAYGGHIRVSTLRLGRSPIDDLALARHGVYKPASNGTPDGAPDSSQQRTLTAFDG
jgi:hypothetical protein